jgi:uncharacterized protein YgiM (DUF1202 family)
MRNITVLFCLCISITTGAFCFAQETAPAVFEAVYATIQGEKVNVRAGQGVNFESLGQLEKSMPVVVLGEEYGWYKVKLPKNCLAYVHKDYVKDNVVTAGALRIRARPGLKSSVLGTLQKGDKIVVRKQEGEWLLIVPEEETAGWIQKDYLKLSSKKYLPAVSLATAVVQETPPQEPLTLKAEKPTPAQITEQPPLPEPKSTQTVKLAKDEYRGIIQDVGKFHKRPAAHKLVQDNGTTYYLKSDSVNLNQYIYRNVSVVGEMQELPGLAYPLISATQVKALAQ